MKTLTKRHLLTIILLAILSLSACDLISDADDSGNKWVDYTSSDSRVITTNGEKKMIEFMDMYNQVGLERELNIAPTNISAFKIISESDFDVDIKKGGAVSTWQDDFVTSEGTEFIIDNQAILKTNPNLQIGDEVAVIDFSVRGNMVATFKICL